MANQTKAVLAVGAHPDDIEFMMAGTLLLLKASGWALHYCNLCDGCCGTATEDVSTITARRALEAQAACRLIGAQFYPSVAPDVQLYHTTEIVAKVVAVIRRANPRILLLPSPHDYMEDHMQASRIGVTAAFARGMRNLPCDPPMAPVGGEMTVYHALPYGLRDALRQRVRAGQYVDITTVLPMKRRMLACHASQKEWLDHSQGLNAYLDAMEAMAREVGQLSGSYAFAEGWRRHLHLGFAAVDQDPLTEVLGPRCRVDAQYEAELNG